MIGLAITIVAVLGFVGLGIWLFEGDDDHDEWRRM